MRKRTTSTEAPEATTPEQVPKVPDPYQAMDNPAVEQPREEAQEVAVRNKDLASKVQRFVNASPYQQLVDFMATSGLQQFKVVLNRRQADGITFSVLRSYALKPEEIQRMPEWVPAEFGGGYFRAEITNPNDLQERVVDYEFSVEGAPIEPKRATGVQQAPTSPYMHPYGTPLQQYPQQGMPQPMGIGGIPYQHPVMAYPRFPYGNTQQSNPELEALKRQVQDLNSTLTRERDQAAMKALQDGFERRLQDMQASNQRQMDAILTRIADVAKPSNSGDQMRDMFGMFMKQAEMQQSMMTTMLTAQSNDRRDQLDNMRKQLETDLAFRREMFEQMERSKDPAKQFAFMDQMGQHTASMLSLIQQAAASGLLGGGGGGDAEPAWLKGLREGFQTLQETAGKYMAMKQQEAAMGAMVRAPQPGAPRLPAPARPQQSRPPQQPGTGTGFGQPIQRAPVAPVVVQQPAPEQVQRPAEKEPAPSPVGSIEPMSFLTIIQRFVGGIEAEADAVEVGDMIWAFADFLRYNEMLPAEWQNVFTQPASTIKAFLGVYAPHIQPKAGYLEAIGKQIIKREAGEDEDEGEQESENEKQEEPPKLRVVEAPQPPVPDEPKQEA